MLDIIPIAKTQVDWNTYLRNMNLIRGESITRNLDDKKIPVGDLYSYILTLKEIGVEEDYSLAHAHYSFIIIAHKEVLNILLKESRNLDIDITRTIKLECFAAIVTGNLEEWRYVIIRLSNNQEHEIRNLSNKIHRFFEQEGFGKIFSEYHKVTNNDFTYSLIELKK